MTLRFKSRYMLQLPGWGVIIADLGKAAGEGSEEMATVFRGVNNESPAYSNALEGIANPRGTALDPVAHNAFDTANSGFTSWTTDLNTPSNLQITAA